MERVREAKFQSILCLMHPKEIDHYRALDLGAPDLLEFYRKHGMSVLHIPWDDPAHRSTEERRGFAEELARVQAEALTGFDNLAKPVLLHCSAGIDRSSPVAAYIFQQRVENHGAV
jgi:protein-tyrosine phosphatase